MPLYEYAPDSGSCQECGGRFEVLQTMQDSPLAACPQCLQPCSRVFSTFAVNKSIRDVLSPKNLEAKGFTQYKKAGDGVYERTAGKDGPQVIQPK